MALTNGRTGILGERLVENESNGRNTYLSAVRKTISNDSIQKGIL